MKKTTNIVSIFLFIILIPFTFIANIITDFLDAWKVKTNLPELPEEKKHTIKTTYPDEPIEDINKWFEYTNKQRN